MNYTCYYKFSEQSGWCQVRHRSVPFYIFFFEKSVCFSTELQVKIVPKEYCRFLLFISLILIYSKIIQITLNDLKFRYASPYLLLPDLYPTYCHNNKKNFFLQVYDIYHWHVILQHLNNVEEKKNNHQRNFFSISNGFYRNFFVPS